MDFLEIVKESSTVDADDFNKVVKQAIGIISGENVDCGKLAPKQKLVNLSPVGEVLVIGDLHGDLASLKAIMMKSAFLERMEACKNATMVFLGDYGDRGILSPEVYYVVLRLKLAFPRQIVLLRGNHEGPSDLMASPHDLPIHLQRKFKEKWIPVYQQIREFFSYLYNAVYVEERYLMVHGGVPRNINSLQEIAEADRLYPEKTFLEELLWNDPDEQVLDTYPSSRGAGNLFGKAVTKAVLRKLNAKILIRGHQSIREGYRINHDGKVLTLFSCKESPYFIAYGAYLDVSLTEKFENASQLLPYIHKF